MKVVFSNSGRLSLASLPARSPKSVTCCLLLVAPPSLLPRLPNLACKILQNHLHVLSPNPFAIIEIFHMQPGLESLQNICNCRLPVQGSISQLFLMVLSPVNGQMLLLKKPCHSYFLPLVERTKVGLPHSFSELLQGEFHLF